MCSFAFVCSLRQAALISKSELEASRKERDRSVSAERERAHLLEAQLHASQEERMRTDGDLAQLKVRM